MSRIMIPTDIIHKEWYKNSNKVSLYLYMMYHSTVSNKDGVRVVNTNIQELAECTGIRIEDNRKSVIENRKEREDIVTLLEWLETSDSSERFCKVLRKETGYIIPTTKVDNSKITLTFTAEKPRQYVVIDSSDYMRIQHEGLNPAVRHLWLTLHLIAAYSATRYNNTNLEAGQAYVTINRLAVITGLSYKQIRNGLARLENRDSVYSAELSSEITKTDSKGKAYIEKKTVAGKFSIITCLDYRTREAYLKEQDEKQHGKKQQVDVIEKKQHDNIEKPVVSSCESPEKDVHAQTASKLRTTYYNMLKSNGMLVENAIEKHFKEYLRLLSENKMSLSEDKQIEVINNTSNKPRIIKPETVLNWMKESAKAASSYAHKINQYDINDISDHTGLIKGLLTLDTLKGGARISIPAQYYRMLNSVFGQGYFNNSNLSSEDKLEEIKTFISQKGIEPIQTIIFGSIIKKYKRHEELEGILIKELGISAYNILRENWAKEYGVVINIRDIQQL